MAPIVKRQDGSEAYLETLELAEDYARDVGGVVLDADPILEGETLSDDGTVPTDEPHTPATRADAKNA